MCKRNSTGIDSVKNRRYKKATVCLVLQCVLLIEAIILLGLELRTKTDEYENSEENYIRNRKKLLVEIQGLLKKTDELVNNINNMNKENHQLNEEKELLSKHLHQMAVISKFQFSVDENKQLTIKLVVLPDGWKCYQSSLYYLSSEWKNWADSKEDCLKRGADLIIINNREEQEYFKTDDGIWIGLTESVVDGTWKWVDGSTLGFSFWATGEPNSDMGKEEDCAMLYPSGWYDYPCNDVFKWVCERKAS